jgi:signal transduction histidine kinase
VVSGNQQEPTVPKQAEPPSLPPHASEATSSKQARSLAERAGGIAHDLNNMLGTMIGYGALVLEDLPADDPNHAFLAKVMEAGAEAKQLVAELLDSARSEAARVKRAGLSKAA